MLMQDHYCDKHQSKFYKNERKTDDGLSRIWYSHKILGGNGFCVEKTEQPETTSKERPTNYMLMCNAMNNAVALAANGKIQINQIGDYFQKLYSELSQA